VPNERGEFYSEMTWSSMRYKAFRDAGITGDYRILRKSSLQNFMENLEEKDYRDAAVAELVALRGRHSVATSLQHYVEFKRGRVRKAVQDLSRTDPAAPVRSASTAPMSTADRLRELDQLRKEGLVTDEEFHECRRRALDALVGPP
jgi:hypothetical protein